MWARRFDLRFSIRELALFVVIIGLGLAWMLDHQRLQGQLRFTGRSLDLAIEGEGYFMLTDERTTGCVYTRRGEFTTDTNVRLVLRLNGVEWPVFPSIQIPSAVESVAVTPSGLVVAQMPATIEYPLNLRGTAVEKPDLRAMGQIQLASFTQANKLKTVSPGIFADTLESGPATFVHPGTEGTGLVRQGMQRRSDH